MGWPTSPPFSAANSFSPFFWRDTPSWSTKQRHSPTEVPAVPIYTLGGYGHKSSLPEIGGRMPEYFAENYAESL
jgi:hypothetical protein